MECMHLQLTMIEADLPLVNDGKALFFLPVAANSTAAR